MRSKKSLIKKNKVVLLIMLILVTNCLYMHLDAETWIKRPDIPAGGGNKRCKDYATTLAIDNHNNVYVGKGKDKYAEGFYVFVNGNWDSTKTIPYPPLEKGYLLKGSATCVGNDKLWFIEGKGIGCWCWDLKTSSQWTEYQPFYKGKGGSSITYGNGHIAATVGGKKFKQGAILGFKHERLPYTIWYMEAVQSEKGKFLPGADIIYISNIDKFAFTMGKTAEFKLRIGPNEFIDLQRIPIQTGKFTGNLAYDIANQRIIAIEGNKSHNIYVMNTIGDPSTWTWTSNHEIARVPDGEYKDHKRVPKRPLIECGLNGNIVYLPLHNTRSFFTWGDFSKSEMPLLQSIKTFQKQTTSITDSTLLVQIPKIMNTLQVKNYTNDFHIYMVNGQKIRNIYDIKGVLLFKSKISNKTYKVVISKK